MDVFIKRFVSVFIFLFVSQLFGATVSITTVSDMVFPVQVWGMGVSVVLAPNDAGAAVFSATGDPNRNAKTTVREKNINMTTGTGMTVLERIKVQNFTVLAPTVFNALGQLNNIRVGATAIVNAGNVEGDYSGTATLRVVYN